MLLSMVGEGNRREHEGAEIAIALLSKPSYSVVLRTLWRVKKKAHGPGLGENRRPDFQEILSDTQLAIWIRKGLSEKAAQPLASRVELAIRHPSTVSRFGGLSLGESTHLVNDASILRDEAIRGRLLMPLDEGDLSLPIWPDHVGSNTRWGQYRLLDKKEITNADLDNKSAWTVIQRPSLAPLTSN
jgi:CRISPR-associated protein Cas5t